MGKLSWYYNRLRAMNLREVAWRVDQKRLQRQERGVYGSKDVNVGEYVFNRSLDSLKFSPELLGINFDNKVYGTETEVHTLKGPDYGKWPSTFSYSLDYKQRDDLGDARTNWEKDRHFDWALTAKAYYVTKEEKYYHELNEKVKEWCRENPYLHGIAWTSAMEFAIRSINWMVTLAFIQKRGKDIPQLRNGIINITEYLTKHYSRFSSANNHLLVEATAIGMAGYAFDNKPWKELSVRILSEELLNQNYEDGVNKELSLHYQTFGMEAYCLMIHTMKCNGDEIPEAWIDMLNKQGEYVSHCIWREKMIMEFGDDDEGKIIDLRGGDWHNFNYILQFVSLLTSCRFSSFDSVEENIAWLFTGDEIKGIKNLPLYNNKESRCFSIGGNLFLRDASDRILIGIDHAELGFGSIAAHGHADALSVQMMVDGKVILADPGTYIYHCNLPMRNEFRKTINHNTVALLDDNGCAIDQSQMLGAFLWGKRANCTLENFQTSSSVDTLTASHDGYLPFKHQRTVEFIGKDTSKPILRIKDAMGEGKWVATWMLGADCSVKEEGEDCIIENDNQIVVLNVGTDIDRIEVEDAEVSEEYGVKKPSKAIRIYGSQPVLSVDFKIFLN